MRPERDFRPQQLYGVTQRGNQGQWVYRDDQDFQQALDLMGKYAAGAGVRGVSLIGQQGVTVGVLIWHFGLSDLTLPYRYKLLAGFLA